MLGFKSAQLIHARVVLGVGPFGRIEDVIEILVVPKLVAQRVDALFGGLIGGAGFMSHRKDYRNSGSGKLEILDRSRIWQEKELTDGAHGVLHEVQG